MPRPRAFLLASATFFFLSGAARADRMTDAEELFRRAKGLMAEKKDREACPLLEESQRLDPQTGTLLNLALCHESIGRVASAWGELRAVEQQARAAGREDRMKLAHDHASKLEARIARLKIVTDAKVEGLVVKVDGEVKAESLWPGIAVDTGTRSVEASAPGKKMLTLKVKVDDEGATVTVTIPHLDDEGPAVVEARPKVEDDAKSSRRTTGLVMGGAGIAVAAAGGVLGVLAILADHDAHDACVAPCVAKSAAAVRADESTDRALLFANVANVAVPLGLVAAIVGGYLFFSARPSKVAAVGSSPLGGSALRLTW